MFRIVLVFLCLCARPAWAADSTNVILRYPERISVFVAGLVTVNEDVRDVYGTIPYFGVRYLHRGNEQTSLTAGVGFGWKHGNPYQERPSFTQRGAALVSILPMELGIRIDALPRSSVSFVWGVDFTAAWVREEYPGSFGRDRRSSESGLFGGFRLAGGPRWTPSRHGPSLTGELLVEVSPYARGVPEEDWLINPTGATVRIHAGWDL